MASASGAPPNEKGKAVMRNVEPEFIELSSDTETTMIKEDQEPVDQQVQEIKQFDQPKRVQPPVEIFCQEDGQPRLHQRVHDEAAEHSRRAWHCRFCPRIFHSQHGFAGHQQAHRLQRAVERGEAPAIGDQSRGHDRNNLPPPPPPQILSNAHPRPSASFDPSLIRAALNTSQQHQSRGREMGLDGIIRQKPRPIFLGRMSADMAINQASWSGLEGEEKNLCMPIPPVVQMAHGHGARAPYTSPVMVPVAAPEQGMGGHYHPRAPIFPLRRPAPHLMKTNEGGSAMEIDAVQGGLHARPLDLNSGAIRGNHQPSRFEPFILNSDVPFDPVANHQPLGAPPPPPPPPPPHPHPPAHQQVNYLIDIALSQRGHHGASSSTSTNDALNMLTQRPRGGDEDESEEVKRRRIEDVRIHLALPGRERLDLDLKLGR